MSNEFPNRPLVHSALDLYFEREVERTRLFDSIFAEGIGNTEVAARYDAWEAQCASDLQDLRESFYEATKDRNSRDNCMLVSVSDLTRMSGYERKFAAA